MAAATLNQYDRSIKAIVTSAQAVSYGKLSPYLEALMLSGLTVNVRHEPPKCVVVQETDHGPHMTYPKTGDVRLQHECHLMRRHAVKARRLRAKVAK